MIGAGVLFVLFCANLIVGKVSVLGGATQLPGFGDVGEFLVLFTAVVLFIAGCLTREAAAQSNEQSENNEKGGKDVG